MTKIKAVSIFIAILSLAGCAGSPELLDLIDQQTHGTSKTATQAQMVAAVREALNQGNARAVKSLGRRDGFMKNPQVRIPMPQNLKRIDQGLRAIGQSKVADDFVLSLNRAGEAAVPLAKDVLVDAVKRMTVKDVVNIVRGPDNAATQYFRKTSEPRLRKGMLPIVSSATTRVGVTRSYKQMISRAGPLSAFVDLKSLDIDSYVTRKTLDGLFLLIAQEEKRIRENPVARTTELLKLVFGGNG